MVRTVFVVDDETIISETLVAILMRSGFNAIPFSDPFKALEAVELNRPDILISDVMMPGLNGIELAIQLRRKSPSCKVVLFSGQAATSDMLEEAHQGDHDFMLLTKPVHPSDLLAAIGHVRVGQYS